MHGLKTSAQVLLRSLGLYYRLKSSRLYDIYWRIVDKRIIDEKLSEVDFYLRHLVGFQPGNLFFDIGANEGYKTDIFLRMGARVVAVEPDEHAREILRKSFITQRLLKKPVVIVGKAISDKKTVQKMWIDAPGSAKNTLSPKWVELLRFDEQRFGAPLSFSVQREVETTTLDSLITAHGQPFFIKIDVEGHEPNVLNGLRRPVPYLSFEVNLPEFKSEGEQCIELLGSLNPTGAFNYSVDCRRFSLESWRAKHEFLPAFRQCGERSIEVFWKGIP
jgi:FkbM family methyltransferase